MYHYLRTKGKKLSCLATVLLSLCVLTLTSFTASASAVPAPETATGTVIDQYGDPMPGASVMVVGTTKGASTDIDGNFSIQGVERGQTLRISMVGCKPVEVKWEGTPLGITLEDDAQALDEVVVVGFGTQKKANLTGAVSTISASELANRPVASAVDALAGLAPGLDIVGANLGGQLNATKTMNIRGIGTIGSGSNVTPLVLIDGMEGDLNTVNPQDIENISILKDAAASSIYGSRAAGGVILVTTKNGKEGRVQVTYSDSFRWSNVTRLPHNANAYVWAVTANDAARNAGEGTYFSESTLAEFKKAVETGYSMLYPDPSDPDHWIFYGVSNTERNVAIGNTDWMYHLFGKTSFSQEHNISVTGGSEKINTYFSANILDQGGILKYGDDKRMRYNLTGRINYQITPWLLFGYSARWSRVDNNAPSYVTDAAGAGLLYHDMTRNWPILPTYDPNGHPTYLSFIEALTNGGRYKSVNDRLDHQFSFLINPLEGLTVNAEMNYSSRNYKVHHAYLQTYAWDIYGEPYQKNAPDYPAGDPIGSQVTDESQITNYFNPNVYATYQFNLRDAHEFKIMAGFQSEWLKYDYFYGQRKDVISNIPYLDTTSGASLLGGYAQEWSTAGFFGRINYDYKGRYLLEGNLRYDGTSRFRRGHRWSLSPSFSLGWNIANEAWFEDVRQKVNTLKVRYSWGKLGNQNTTLWYPTYSNMCYTVSGSEWLVNGEKTTVATMPGIVSSSLTWEKNRTWDIGLDWGFLNNRLTGTFDYYNRKTIDMVGPGEILPNVLGTAANASGFVTGPSTNNLSMTSKGWELNVSWRDRIQDFSYGVTLNLYDHIITIDEYPNDANTLSTYYPGARYGDIWGYTTIGIAKTQAEMDAHLATADQSQLGSQWAAGDIMYADLDGDGVISQGENTLANHGDLTVIGNTTPRYNYGIILDAQWKGFDLRIFFQGVGKRDYYPTNTNNNISMFWGFTNNARYQSNLFEYQLDYFRPEDTTNPLGPNVDAYYPRPNYTTGTKNKVTQTRFLQNAAYCALKNVTIGYTLPQKLTRKAYIENVRVFFSGENLAKITKFTKQGDPELIEAYNQAGFGKVYPLSRVFSCGLNVTF